MIEVCIRRKKTGEFVSCSANGHAGFDIKGCDIVCAAATILMRTTMNVFLKSGLLSEKKAMRRGELFFSAKANANEDESKVLKYANDFLVSGFDSLTKEFPRNVSLKIICEKIDLRNKTKIEE